MRNNAYEIDLPKHMAFIIDGNGRWAKRRGLPRTMGHKAGLKRLIKTTKYAFSKGIYCISVFCFSTENWNRPKDEVNYLFSLFRDNFETEFDDLVSMGVRLRVMGDITRLPSDVQESITRAVSRSEGNTKHILNLAINYGGRAEIVRACNEAVKEGKVVTEESLDRLMYTGNLPPLDFLIRTSGEIRISNFMLWQVAYAELYFAKCMWPDFNNKQLDKALLEYSRRNRRFGAIKES